MGEVLPLPSRGEVFLDPRGEGRSLRVSWHQAEHMLVLSLWQFGQCRATFRLPSDQVPELVRALVAGLSDGLAQHESPPSGGSTVSLTRAVKSARHPDESPTAPVATESPTVAVDPEGPTVPDGPTLAVDAAEPTAAVATAAVATDEVPPGDIGGQPPSGTGTQPTGRAERSAAPAAIFLAPPAEA